MPGRGVHAGGPEDCGRVSQEDRGRRAAQGGQGEVPGAAHCGRYRTVTSPEWAGKPFKGLRSGWENDVT